MRMAVRLPVLAVGLAVALVVPLAAIAAPSALSTFTWSKNIHPLGQALSPVPLTGPGSGVFISDLAFWGNRAYQGTYNGWNVVDITAPGNPDKLLDYNECAPDNPVTGAAVTTGNQGDLLLWGTGSKPNLLIRAWNSATPAAGSSCGGLPMAPGEEGIHIFDISDELNPQALAFVDLPQGTHTLTLVPDVSNDRLLIYGNSSSGANPGIDIVEVPLANPAAAAFLRFEPAGRSCHDVSVILGSAMLVSCAGSAAGIPGVTVWTVDPSLGGSLTDPAELYQVSVADTTTGHSTTFTWDGKVMLFGTEPGGGGQARCQATGVGTQTDNQKSIFFYNARTGAFLGQHILPRPQTALENCTIHNMNTVPLRSLGGKSRYVVVHGSYQSGIGVVDFSDIANGNSKEIAYADPDPLINPDNPAAIEISGDWSTYWYNGRIYESDITRGLLVWNLSDNAVAGNLNLPYLNPQTQEMTIN